MDERKEIERIQRMDDIEALQLLFANYTEDISTLRGMAVTDDAKKETLESFIRMRDAIEARMKAMLESNEKDQFETSFNHKFHMAAKLMLSKETYDKICHEANKPARDIRMNRKELRTNKIE